MLTRIAVVIEMSMVDSAAGRKAIVRVSTFLPLEVMEKTKLIKVPAKLANVPGFGRRVSNLGPIRRNDFPNATVATHVNG